MSFIRLSDNYIDHPKFLALSASAFRLWHEGMAFCRKHQTDGIIPFPALNGFRYFKGKSVTELLAPYKPGANPLWNEILTLGYKVHDYLEWNHSKEEEDVQKMLNGHRSAFYRDKGLRQKLRDRDGDDCRYCGAAVNWADRKGGKGATYDHVNPRGEATMENLVIACRSCHSVKRGRTPQEAGMVLRSPPDKSPDKSRFNLGRISDSTGLDRREEILVNRSEKESEEKPRLHRPGASIAESPFPDPQDRAVWLLERYAELFIVHRLGAKYFARPHVDLPEAVRLIAVWENARLEKLAALVLTTDDPWIAKTDRSFKIFAMKASWADDKLRAWEREHHVQA